MRKLRKFGVLGAVCAMSLVGVAQASATTATFSGTSPQTVSATSGTTYLRVGGVTLSCTSSSATATVNNATGTLPLTVSTNALLGFNTCTVLGIRFTVSCTNTAVMQVTSTTVGGVTNGTVSNISCRILGTGCSSDPVVTGRVNITYTNGSPARLTVLSTGQALNVASPSGCIVPSGAASFSSSSGSVTNVVYTVSPSTLTLNVV